MDVVSVGGASSARGLRPVEVEPGIVGSDHGTGRGERPVNVGRPGSACLVGCLLLSLACSKPSRVDTSEFLEPIGMPALRSGTHLGYILGFSPLTDENQGAVLDNQQALIDAGLQVGRTQISWRDLEPAPGQFDEAALDELLEPLLEDELAVALTLETIDSSSFEIPEDLVEDELTLVDGRSLDDPMILTRLETMLGWLTPKLAATRSNGAPGVYAIMVGNEPDNTIVDQPDLGPEVAVFTEHARKVIREHDPELAVSMTLTLESIGPNGDYAPPIVAASDFLAINYYCHRDLDDWTVKDEAETESDTAAMRELADGRPILIQELGCSTGFEDGVLQVGEDGQAEWLERMVGTFAADPGTFRVAHWFTLADWSPEVAALISQPLCDEGFPQLCVELDEAVQTYGLLRWEDGSPRRGYDVFLDAIRKE